MARLAEKCTLIQYTCAPVARCCSFTIGWGRQPPVNGIEIELCQVSFQAVRFHITDCGAPAYPRELPG